MPESLVEEVLAWNLGVIEEDLRITGRQVSLPGMVRMDILAYDRHGISVVIEVKSGIADDVTFT